jgi:hypothetical protein
VGGQADEDKHKQIQSRKGKSVGRDEYVDRATLLLGA